MLIANLTMQKNAQKEFHKISFVKHILLPEYLI